MKRIKRLIYPNGPNGVWAPVLAAVILLGSTTMVLRAWHLSPNSKHIAQQTEQNSADRWQKWLHEEVVYIISDEEKAAFARLTTDEEREHFVEEFWARRNPTPGAAENKFKEEHYRRVGYANDHFAGNQPGWKPAEAAFISDMGHRMKSIPIHRAAATSGPNRKVAAQRKLIPSRTGAINTSKALAT